MGAIIFRPTLWPTFATAVLLPTLILLGLWQLDRAEQKRELLHEFETLGQQTVILRTDPAVSIPRYQRVELRGRYDPQRRFLLDAMPGSGGAGFHVLSLFRPTGSATSVVIDRGWIPGSGNRDELPDPAVPSGEQVLKGRLAYLPRPGLELEGEGTATDVWPRLMLFPTMEELQAAAGIKLYPMLVWLDPDEPGGFERDWRPTSSGPDRHIAYAVQWFGLAAALLVIFIAVNLDRKPSRDGVE